jgi:hypothetical protein
MAKVVTKNTRLQKSIAAVYTTIAQVKSLKGPNPKVQTYDATALDSGVGMENKVTGYTQGGTVSGTLFFDPAATTHKSMLSTATTPASDSWKIIFADSGLTEWPFTGIVTDPPSPTVDVNAGLMADFSIMLDGIVTYP